MKRGVVLLVVALVALVGCSKSTDPVDSVPTLQQVRAEYPAGAMVVDSVDGLNFEVYAGAGGGYTLALYQRPDSCAVFAVDSVGNVLPVMKPKNDVWNCIARQSSLCRHLHPDEDEAYWRCVSKGIQSCTIVYYLFGWLCD
jgi:hypothetical protein